MKITLSNLSKATAQQVFEHVATHLLEQGERSSDGNGECQYRTRKDDKVLTCAAGCLIAKSEYESDWEGERWEALTAEGKVGSIHTDLIQSLQTVHDHIPTKDWHERLVRFGENRGLNIEFLAVSA